MGLSSGVVNGLFLRLSTLPSLPKAIRKEIDPLTNSDTTEVSRCVAFRGDGVVFTLPGRERELILFPSDEPSDTEIYWEQRTAGDRSTVITGKCLITDSEKIEKLFGWLKN